MKIAISKNDRIFHHSGSWVVPWIDYCQRNNIPHEIVDGYQSGIIDRLSGFDCLLWHINNYVLPDMLIGRSVLNSASELGLRVFPDNNTAWHFDDKIAETYLLQAVKSPIPDSRIFYLLEDCSHWLEREARYPLVAKLRSGSGSNNIRLLGSKKEAYKYVKRMFGMGYHTYPSLFFKAKSQVKSSKDWSAFKTRMKRIPEFLHTLSRARMFPRERGYVFFQEYIPNDGYDLKIVVIGDKLSYIGRRTRKSDFRASGGGDLFFDKNLVLQNIIDSAFSTSEKLGFQCMGYDYVVDKRDGFGRIVEMSYGFSHTALLQSGGYFDRNGKWYEEPLNAPVEIIKNLIKQY